MKRCVFVPLDVRIPLRLNELVYSIAYATYTVSLSTVSITRQVVGTCRDSIAFWY